MPAEFAGLSAEVRGFIEQLLAIIARQADEIQVLRDEVALLKGHKPRPKFKGSGLFKAAERGDKKRPPGDGEDPPGGGLRPGSAT